MIAHMTWNGFAHIPDNFQALFLLDPPIQRLTLSLTSILCNLRLMPKTFHPKIVKHVTKISNYAMCHHGGSIIFDTSVQLSLTLIISKFSPFTHSHSPSKNPQPIRYTTIYVPYYSSIIYIILWIAWRFQNFVGIWFQGLGSNLSMK